MPEQDFTQSFISAFQQGQQFLDAKRRRQQEDEDRVIDKEILQHRLRTMKLEEKLRGRNLAIENLKLLQGTPRAQIPQGMGTGPIQRSPEVVPYPDPGAIDFAENTFKPIKIPGVPEYGVPDIEQTPQTMEDVMQQLMQKTQIENLYKNYELSADETLWNPLAGVVARGVPRTVTPPVDPLVPLRNQAKPGGPTVTTYRRRSEIPSGFQTTDYIDPSQAGGSGTPQPSKQQIDDAVYMISTHQTPPTIPQGGLGAIYLSGLRGAGFNVAKAQLEHAAARRLINSMNSGQMGELMVAANTAEMALEGLKALNMMWEADFTRKSEFLSNMSDPEMKAAINEHISLINANIGRLKAAGDAPSAKAMDSAMAFLSGDLSQTRMAAAIKALEQTLAYRAAAIRNTGAVMPQTLPGGDASGATTPANLPPHMTPLGLKVEAVLRTRGEPHDPATVAAIVGNQTALKRLFPAGIPQ